MQNSDRNKNNSGRKTERYSRYGRAARCLSIMMALVFSVTSLGAALPADATSTVSSAAESVSLDTSASSSSDESTASNASAASSSESAANSTFSSSATPELTPHVTPTPTERTYDSTVDVKEKNGTLKVTAKADAGVLSEGAVLTVKPITKENTETKSAYQQVENKVKKNAADDSRELTGFLAYDISFIKDNKEIEPNGKVNVTMEWAQAATPATNANDKDAKVSVLHLEKQDDSDQIKDTKVVNLTENKEKGEDKNNQASVEVKGEDKAVKKAEITVKGFSIFTITWTTTSGNTTHIGQVKLHYVDENGEELDTPTMQPTSNMLTKYSNGIVTLKDYAVDTANSNATRMANYTYKAARMGNAKTGDVITGLMVTSSTSENTTTYSLKYTSDDSVPSNTSDSRWKTVPADAVTGANNNSVDVYLVYQQNDHITVHYVDGAGNQIADSVKKYLSENTVMGKDGISLKTDTSWKQDIDGYTYNSAHLGSTLGDTVVAIKGVKDGDTYKLQAKNKDKDSFTDATTMDLYLVYEKNDAKKVEVYYTDIAGIPITDAAGQPIKKVYDPSTWANGTHSFVDDATSYTPDGYATFDGKTNFNSGDRPSWWNTNDKAEVNNTQNKIVYGTDNYISGASGTFGGESFRYLRGYCITSMKYNSESGVLTIVGNPNTQVLPSSEKSPYKVYIMYKKQIVIHDIDSNGKELGTRTDERWFVGFDYTGLDKCVYSYGTTASNSVITGNSAYGTLGTIYVKDSSGNITKVNTSDNSNTFRIAWQFSGAAGSSDVVQDTSLTKNNHTAGTISSTATNKSNGTGKWITRVTTGTGSDDHVDFDNQRITDIYMQYDYNAKSVTVHHIDSDGKQIADDTKETFTADKTITPSTGNGYIISGYTLAGGKVDMSTSSGMSRGGTNFYSYTVSKGGDNTWTAHYKTSADASTDSTPTNSNDIWLVYAENKTVTIHYVLDSTGGTLRKDTTRTVSDQNMTFTPTRDGETITNFDRSGGKYRMTKGDGGNVKDGTQFYSITYKPNADGTWESTYKAAENGEDTSVGSAPDELWYVYSANTTNRVVTVHFVDTDGTIIANPVSGKALDDYNNTDWHGTFAFQWTNASNSDSYRKIDKSVYSFVGEYIGPTFNREDNKLVTKTVGDTKAWVQWQKDASGNWHTSHSTQNEGAQHNANDQTVITGCITDIYWVFNKTKDSNDLILHYIHPVYGDNDVVMDKDGNPTYSQFKDDKGDVTEDNVTISYKTVADGRDTGLLLNVDPQAKSIKDYTYYGSYLATPDSDGLPDYARLTTDAPHVRAVRVHNGKYQFLVVSGDGTADLSLSRRNQWSYTTTGGRTYTLRKTSTTEGGTTNNTLTMLDSMVGRSAYDLSLESTTTDANENTVNTYTGTSGAEGTGVAYSVKETVPKAGSTTYTLTVYEWSGVSQHDIYQLYTKKTDTPVVTISNEVVYSGNLVARLVNFENKTVVSYKWEKQINNGEWTEVVRAQNGSEWNIAHDLKDRSWLDLAADNGELSNDEGRTSVKYRVTLTYSDDTGNHDVTSQEFSVPYWDQLENGSFENVPNGGGGVVQYSNSAYKKHGVWQTTGPGSGDYKNQDIEIANTEESKNDDSNSVWYQKAYGWPGNEKVAKDTADGGSQFAELNCEAAGALYQDVITHPNEYLNYWLSHRARGSMNQRPAASAAAKYDTMYLVIMPTKLAMTSASDGGELKTQEDLEAFIDKHGGYDHETNNTRTEEENKVIFRDTNSGILVVRITSDNQNWHSISEANGYIATSSLTRFFFVAGPVSYHTGDGSRDKTVGNLLDAVGFSQKLQTPETPHYHVVVKKTFSGLTANEVAKLASNKAGSNAFKFTIDEYADKDGTTKRVGEDAHFELDTNSKDKYVTLNGAVLSFNVDSSNNFTLTATGKDPNDASKSVNLLTNGSTGAVSEDPDTGDITMTWTLYNEYFGRGVDDKVDSKYFKVTESNTDLEGYSTATTYNATVEHGDSTSTDVYNTESSNVTDVITVKNKDTARINYNNTYRDNTHDEPDQITVQKKFTGITPTVVGNLMGATNPYEIIVNNPNESPIVLVGNPDRPVKDGKYPDGVDHVSLKTSVDSRGISTFTWTIVGSSGNDWVRSGKYTVSEANYSIHEYPLSGITLNGDDVKPWSDIGQSVVIGDADDKLPGIKLEGDNKEVDIKEEIYNLVNNPNLIAAKYQYGSNENNAGYIVWTPNAVGLNEKQAIINHLKSVSVFNDANAKFEFRTGENPGVMTVGPENGAGTFSYDGNTHQLQFINSTASSGTKWRSYYSTRYTLTGNQATEIRITNSYEPAVRILKVDRKNQTIPLKGAEFKLSKKAVGGAERQYLKLENNMPSWSDNSDDASVLETNDEGFVVYNGSDTSAMQTISQLKSGTYYIEETKAPAGYNMPIKPIVAFKVNSEGVVSALTPDEVIRDELKESIDQTRLTKVDWNSPYYTLTITNTAGAVLPSTGGAGTWPYIFIGLLMILTAGGWLGFRAGMQHQKETI